MARYTDSVCRLCRREGVKLYLKATRCETAKCAIDRRAYLPGQHGQGRKKFSEYGVQLREKQKVKRFYGVLEKQFRIYFAAADRKKGVTGENLLQQLESRLDNVIYRMGLGESRSAARQLIGHNHFLVNGKRVNIPSYIVRKGDVIAPNPRKIEKAPFKKAMEQAKGKNLPHWLSFDVESKQGLVQALPTREDVTLAVEEQLIVELYSR
ncbi:SSU ribosomal protein S4p (S9e) @ SSU ribosomal protein S4p (S9e), zinc-dependent [hydrothermal vent metagenome]|uniref:SSU ribosomal protein S4p (S9e) @ SSU ribosomal protein S4p (S9e), zinc-dependent n=1 Tax=hydrothermal vent metagenome TaxID=652676 RepID=A0A3B1CLS1_9ZZZZ